MINKKRRIFLKNNLILIPLLNISELKPSKNKKEIFLIEKFYSMGTFGKIQIFTKNITKGKEIIKKAIEKIKDIEKLLTKFSPYSDIGKINNKPLNYKKISKETLYVLKTGIKISLLTDGYFDIGLGNILSISGIDNIPIKENKLKTEYYKSNLIKFSKKKAMLTRRNSMIDLGGIGKGYALDEAIKIFKKYGVRHSAVEFGGEIKVNGGTPSGKPWKIIFNKKLNIKKKIELTNGSVAISGNYLKRGNIFNSLNHHIINPKTLVSSKNKNIIIVIGKKSIICDSLSTACYCMDKTTLLKIKNIFSKYKIEIIKKWILLK